MTDIIEIIARAIVKHDDGCDWDTMSERARDWEMGVAQAAIAGLAEAGMVIVPREPTEAMCEAGWRQMPDGIADAYREMIAADHIMPPPVRDAGPLEAMEADDAGDTTDMVTPLDTTGGAR